MTTDQFCAWSFLRDVLGRGAAIQQDYAAGNYTGYGVYAARLDAVARELADWLGPYLADARLTDPAPVTPAVLRELGFGVSDKDAALRRAMPFGRVLRVWPTGGVELVAPGVTDGVFRLVEAGCTAGRLRGLVAALEGS